MNTIRTHLIRTFEQRAMHAAYRRRVQGTRTPHVGSGRAHAPHHTPPVQLFVR